MKGYRLIIFKQFSVYIALGSAKKRNDLTVYADLTTIAPVFTLFQFAHKNTPSAKNSAHRKTPKQPVETILNFNYYTTNACISQLNIMERYIYLPENII